MGLPQLSNLLWRERDLLELLLFKLEQEQLLLAAGKCRWIARATHEVEMVLEAIGQAEVVRAAEVEAVARELGLPSDTGLRDLSAAVPAPWGDLLAEHRGQFLELTDAITALAEVNRGLVTAARRATITTLRTIDTRMPEPTTYDPVGTREALALGDLAARTKGLANVESIVLAETITRDQIANTVYQAALGATARVVQASLMDFLR